MKLLARIMRRHNLRLHVRPPNGQYTKFEARVWAGNRSLRHAVMGEPYYAGESDDLEEAIARAVDTFLGDLKEAE